VTPLPASGIPAGAATGCQYCRQVPLQFDFPTLSEANAYTVRPVLVTRTAPSGELPVFSATPAAADEAGGVAPAPEPPELLLPQAATVSATAAAPAASTRPFLSRRDLVGPSCPSWIELVVMSASCSSAGGTRQCAVGFNSRMLPQPAALSHGRRPRVRARRGWTPG
jgi:hypothetical protein